MHYLNHTDSNTPPCAPFGPWPQNLIYCKLSREHGHKAIYCRYVRESKWKNKGGREREREEEEEKKREREEEEEKPPAPPPSLITSIPPSLQPSIPPCLHTSDPPIPVLSP
ncbi:atrophin-1-like [Oncorhynchus nerka]|uniref:atrophin-1-like n=1 Tax=Oncorhynchus nerka TaxID=8023 RepID=UPI0031B87BF3